MISALHGYVIYNIKTICLTTVSPQEIHFIEPIKRTEGKSQAENVLHDTVETNNFSVTLSRQRVVDSPTPTK